MNLRTILLSIGTPLMIHAPHSALKIFNAIKQKLDNKEISDIHTLRRILMHELMHHEGSDEIYNTLTADNILFDAIQLHLNS